MKLDIHKDALVGWDILRIVAWYQMQVLYPKDWPGLEMYDMKCLLAYMKVLMVLLIALLFRVHAEKKSNLRTLWKTFPGLG